MSDAENFEFREIDTPSLQRSLQAVLDAHFESKREIKKLERHPHPYQTSFPLEELDVTFTDGETLQLVFKVVSWESLTQEARRAKPDILFDPSREIAVYRAILSHDAFGTATCYGTFADEQHPSGGGLFLEKVRGQELYQMGDAKTWAEAARWLARFHARFLNIDEALSPAIKSHLIEWNIDRLRLFGARAEQFVLPKLSFADAARFRHALATHKRVTRRLAVLPTTLLHGEFYASNIMVDDTVQPVRICPIDWEMAGIGPGLLDLAALVSGKWTKRDRLMFLSSYYRELNQVSPVTSSDFAASLLHDLLYCRLQVAMQWLGWSEDWTPPAEHRHNWLAEAFELAEQIDQRRTT